MCQTSGLPAHKARTRESSPRTKLQSLAQSRWSKSTCVSQGKASSLQAAGVFASGCAHGAVVCAVCTACTACTAYRAAPCTTQLITQHLTRRTTQLITQHLTRRTTQQSSLIEEFHRKMQNASSTGLPRVPEVIFQRFKFFTTSTFLLLLLTLIYT